MSTVPLLLAYAEIDVPYYIEQALAVRDALCAANRCPKMAVLAGHSHMSEIYAINTGNSAFAKPFLDFVRAQK